MLHLSNPCVKILSLTNERVNAKGKCSPPMIPCSVRGTGRIGEW